MQELNKFKTHINLAEFATAFGYYRDKEKSSVNAPVMRHDERGDKIVIGKDRSDGHYIYFNPNDESDSGTIIDFVQKRTGETLGYVRKRLRAWMHDPQPQENISVRASTKDALRIASIWERIEKVNPHFVQYWSLGINGNNELGQMKNVKYAEDKYFYFMLSNTSGICGIEKRNDEEKHIIAGSEKGIFVNGNLSNAQNIYIFESPIDMMSHRQMGFHDIADYAVCTMGSIGESAEKSLKAIFERNRDAKVVIAVDNDRGGSLATEKIYEILEQVDGDLERVERHLPNAKDWNDDLSNQKMRQRMNARTKSRGRRR
jgi:hypothetical protein